MASSVKHFCTICHDDGTSNRAVTWCTECEVLFCEDCEKPHSKSRLSKNHKTMSSEDYHQLPTFMQEISSQCRDHKKKFELYCSFHACPCCVQCITDKHKKCQDLKPLSDILKQVKSSASVHLFEKDLKDVKENLDTTIKYIKTRISTINTQKTKAVGEIRYMKKSINDYLNNLERDILNELESKHSKLKLDMASLLQQMEQRASEVNQMQSQFTKMKQYATELQMYIGLREIEKSTSQMAKYIADLESGDNFIEKNLEVKISSALQSILLDVKSFGDIDINPTSSSLQIKAGRKEQAQNLISKVPDIEQIKPSLLTRLSIPKDMRTLIISVCCILPDGKFIILDYHKRQLLLFSKDGIFIRKVVTFTQDPCDACFVRNNTVAVSLQLANQITLVDIVQNKIIQTIELSHFCYGVASDGETLVISSGDGQCTRVNMNDMSPTPLEGMKGVGHISLFQGNIYGTNYWGDKVCCFKSTGEPLWTFQHQDIDRPVGITLDKNGFVYIASSGTGSVVVVSPDGKTCKTILSKADGTNYHRGIDINKVTGMLIVSSELAIKDIERALNENKEAKPSKKRKKTEKTIVCSRCEIIIKRNTQITDLGLYEVQYGSKKQVATAVVLASGTEMDMMANKLDREISEDNRSPTPSPAPSPTPSPRSPTPPPSSQPPPPRSSSNRPSDKMPTLRIPARRRKNTNKQQKKKSTPGNVILTGNPPSSDEEQPPPAPEILTPQPQAPAPAPASAPTPAPAPTPSPTALPNHIFPDDHRIYRLFDVMISGQSRLFTMMANFGKRLRTMETKQDKLHAKQDKLEQMLTTQRQATPGLLAIASDDDTDDENTIPDDMIIPADRLCILKERAYSAGNFASLLLKELMSHLFGQEILRYMYNWNGGWINAKREVCPRAKLAVRQYLVHYYPECRKEDTYGNVVVHKVTS